MRLWTDDDLPELRFPEAFERARHLGERADLLRYELLVRRGGVYVDTDVECLRPIDPLLEGVSAFAGEVREGKLGNAVLGCVAGHPAFERLLEQAAAGAGTGHVSGATGPRLLTQALTGAENVALFPPEAFYPFHHRRGPGKEHAAEGDAYAIHHVDASWKDADALRDDIRRLRNRLERRQARNKRLRHSRRALRRRAKRATARRRALSRRLGRSEARLRAVESSRWWRLGVRLASLARRGRR